MKYFFAVLSVVFVLLFAMVGYTYFSGEYRSGRFRGLDRATGACAADYTEFQ